MKSVLIRRLFDTGNETIGRLTVRDGPVTFSCFTVERPWKGNQASVSCIPPGAYLATRGNFKGRYLDFELQDVPSRSAIEFHIANRSSELEGCIAPGLRISIFGGEVGVADSKRAHDEIMRILGVGPVVFFVEGVR